MRTELRDYFEDGVHLVTYGSEDLEPTLRRCLEDAEGSAAIARRGQAMLRETYAYEGLYSRLFDELRRRPPRPNRPTRSQAYFHLGLLYWHQTKLAWSKLGVFALPHVLSQPTPL